MKGAHLYRGLSNNISLSVQLINILLIEAWELNLSGNVGH